MALVPTPNSFQRLEPVPLDNTEVFSTYTDLTAYAASPTAYRGQICSVSGDNIAYIINNDYTLQPLGLESVSDIKFLPLSGGFVTGDIISNSAISANEIDVDNIQLEGNTISITNTNGDLTLSPNGNGEVNISKVDIDGGTIDGTTIGQSSRAEGYFTNIEASGNVSIDGNLFVTGSSTTINTVDLVIADPIIYLAEGNEGDTVDMGFTVAYDYNLEPHRHAGLLRNNVNKKWTLFSNLSTEVLSATNINFSDDSLVIDTLIANVEGTLTGNVSGVAAKTESLTTARTISAGTGGDISWSVAFDGTQNVSNPATIVNNSVVTAKISNNNVTYGKIQQVGANKILGNSTGSTANVTEIDCTAAGRALLDDASAADQRITLGVGTTQTPAFLGVDVNNGTSSNVTRVYTESVVGTNSVTLSTIPAVTYGTVKYIVQIKDTTNSERVSFEVLATKNVSTWQGTVYAIIDPADMFVNVQFLNSTTVNLLITLNGNSSYTVTSVANAITD